MRIGSIPRAWKRSVGPWIELKLFRRCSIVTFRPEFNAPWMGQPHVTSLTLNRLGEREAATIIDGLVGNKDFRLT